MAGPAGRRKRSRENDTGQQPKKKKSYCQRNPQVTQRVVTFTMVQPDRMVPKKVPFSTALKDFLILMSLQPPRWLYQEEKMPASIHHRITSRMSQPFLGKKKINELMVGYLDFPMDANTCWKRPGRH